jgi:alpha-galactosidase
LFNLSETSRTVSVAWQELALKGRQRTRDVWRQVDAGKAEGQLSREVAPHGVNFLRLTGDVR